MKSVSKLLLSSALLAAPASQADLIANWNFNTGNSGTANYEWPGPIAASHGAGTLDMSGWLHQDSGTPTATPGKTSAGTGTTLAAYGSDPDGMRLSLIWNTNTNGGALPSDTNGAYFDFQISATNFEDLAMTYAYRTGGSGPFTNIKALYSTDGASFTDLAGDDETIVIANSTNGFGYHTKLLDFSAVGDLDAAASVTIRMVLTGATDNGSGFWMDNVTVTGTAVPEPGALSLLVFGGLCVCGRGWRSSR